MICGLFVLVGATVLLLSGCEGRGGPVLDEHIMVKTINRGWWREDG